MIDYIAISVLTIALIWCDIVMYEFINDNKTY